MISKEKFVEILNRLKKYNTLQFKIQDLFDDLIDNKEHDFMNAGSICVAHESIVVDLLEEMFNTDLISWWIYELNYGIYYTKGCLQKEENGKVVNIDVSTPEKLYDYLIEEAKKDV